MTKKIYETIGANRTGTGLLLENDGYISINMPENKVLKESIDNFKAGLAHDLPRPFVVSAVFQKYGVKNANGRIYPEEVLKREVEKYQKNVRERRGFGELEHPDDSNINLERVCINIVELHWVGHTLIGKIELPITEGFRRYGVCSNLADLVAQWIISELRVGVSSRALGSVIQKGDYLLVGDDLEIICWDVVSTPSTPLAYIDKDEENLRPFIQENIEENVSKDIILEDNKFNKFKKWLND